MLVVGLVGGLVASLTACGGLDVHAVTDDLQVAIEGVPQYAGGDVRFTDDFTQGTVISGILRVTGDDRADAVAGCEAILEAVAESYPTVIGANAADVELTCSPARDGPEHTVAAADVLTEHGRGKITTDDLREHFGL